MTTLNILRVLRLATKPTHPIGEHQEISSTTRKHLSLRFTSTRDLLACESARIPDDSCLGSKIIRIRGSHAMVGSYSFTESALIERRLTDVLSNLWKR